MSFLLELRENFKKIYNKYDVYINPCAKFLLALVSFLLINRSIGYMNRLNNPIFTVLFAVLCAFVPSGFAIFLLSVYMLLHLYAISAEFALIVLGIVILMYLLYFRFASKQGYLLVLTAILCWMHMPYVIPVAVGLAVGVSAAIPVGFGVVIYYIIQTASAYESAITNQSVSDSMQKISYIIESLANNKAMLIVLAAVVCTVIVVYFVRRLRIDYAWTYAIVAGTAVQFLIVLIGEILFSAHLNVILLTIGALLGAGVGYLCQVLFFSVDYKRTEYVQYEDDEYYYYVKAVPKINIANEDVKVKQINARKTRKATDINEVAGTTQEHTAEEYEDTRTYHKDEF